MNSNKMRVGVIGVGTLGKHHARLYKNINDAQLIGVYDINPETAKKVASELNTKAFQSLEDIADNCEGFSIAVPATDHYKIAFFLLNKKKHLLIEKPIASNLQQAGEIVKIARENGLIIEIGHTERYNPVTDFIDGKINDVRFIEAKRMSPYPPARHGKEPRGTEVGVVLDMMIHDLELILHIVKSKVERVEASGISVLSSSEDMANARITFKNGCVANIIASRVSEKSIRTMHIYQPAKFISLDYANKTCTVFSKDNSSIQKEEIPIVDHNALQKELTTFVSNALSTIQTGKTAESKVSGKIGLEALRLAVKITEEINKHNKKYGINDKVYSPNNIF
ncbi:MAG TPA: oxidoreductase [Lentisphaeria bacterium]|nr:MAG: hypothetical protein A2X47_06620 [Lentisphaerae bacterium GWF2_38_69]HBM15495.1 oxidoreductase [Lentisphaeria bacterium]